jgi:hypothetical protein
MPGITTMRSLLPASNTASWMLSNPHSFLNFLFCRFSLRAFLRLIFSGSSEGRSSIPSFFACRIAYLASFIELGWQTTCVSPGRLSLSADLSVRASGTSPPAAGLTLVSGAGSGQYVLRSTCAWASAGRASTPAAKIAAVAVRLALCGLVFVEPLAIVRPSWASRPPCPGAAPY